jgi:hypothetical protein
VHLRMPKCTAARGPGASAANGVLPLPSLWHVADRQHKLLAHCAPGCGNGWPFSRVPRSMPVKASGALQKKGSAGIAPMGGGWRRAGNDAGAIVGGRGAPSTLSGQQKKVSQFRAAQAARGAAPGGKV